MSTVEIIFNILDIIGVISFAISGSYVAIQKSMDIFGVCIISLLTCTFGGALRDIILGITPPNVFINPRDAIIAIIISIFTFIYISKKHTIENRKLNELLMLITDSLGLGIFTVLGIRVSMSVGYSNNYFLLLFVAVITGVGGGVIRDVLTGNMPYIFVKHFYACASLIGAIITVIFWNITGSIIAMFIGIIVTFTLRLLAAHYKWDLPKIEYKE